MSAKYPVIVSLERPLDSLSKIKNNMKVEKIIRVFTWKGTKLPDPNPAGSIESVRDTLTHTHPEIANAVIDGPKVEGATHTYNFVASVGTKG